MSLETFDPTNITLPPSMVSDIVMGAIVVIWGAIFIGLVYFIISYFRYNIPVELFVKEGLTYIKTKDTSAREITSTKGSEYELRTSMFKGKKKKEFFRIDKLEHKIPSRKGVIFKLIRAGFNDYHPIPLTNPETRLQVVSQNNIGWLATKVQQIHTKYAEKSLWNHPALLPMTFVVVAIIEFIIIMMVLDKTGEISGTCNAAKQSIVDTVTQRIK